MKVRKHLVFDGEVQGVGFRYRAYVIAQELKLTGWVRNLADGRVEMEAQGEEDQIILLTRRLRDAKRIVITQIEVEERRPEIWETKFKIRN